MPNLVLPVGAEVKLHPGGMHMMLLQLRRKLVAGDTVSLYLSLARAGAAHVRAPVVPYADLERVLGLSPEVRK
jgi:copper(I)-binding protein